MGTAIVQKERERTKEKRNVNQATTVDDLKPILRRMLDDVEAVKKFIDMEQE